LCGCETWSLALRNEHRLRIFANRKLWRRLDVRQKWREDGEDSFNEELHNLYTSFSKYYLDNKVKDDSIGGVRRKQERNE
jgi:hypothetical protein